MGATLGLMYIFPNKPKNIHKPLLVNNLSSNLLKYILKYIKVNVVYIKHIALHLLYKHEKGSCVDRAASVIK